VKVVEFYCWVEKKLLEKWSLCLEEDCPWLVEPDAAHGTGGRRARVVETRVNREGNDGP